MILDIIKVIGGLADKLIPDPKAKQEFNLKLAELADKAAAREHEAQMGQVETNKVEAAHRSTFIAGWRPAVGWACAAGVTWLYVAAPIVEFLARLAGWKGAMPEINGPELTTLLFAMLGLAGMRSFDKSKGTADDTPLGKTIALPPPVAQPALPAPAEAPKKKRRFRIG
jgi:hypothetical protein